MQQETRFWTVGLKRPESKFWPRPIRDLVPTGAELQRQGCLKLKRRQPPEGTVGSIDY